MPRAPSSRARGTTRPTAARPLRRAIQRSVENPLAKAMLGGQFTRGDTVHIDVRDGSLTFDKGSRVEDEEPAVSA